MNNILKQHKDDTIPKSLKLVHRLGNWYLSLPQEEIVISKLFRCINLIQPSSLYVSVWWRRNHQTVEQLFAQKKDNFTLCKHRSEYFKILIDILNETNGLEDVQKLNVLIKTRARALELRFDYGFDHQWRPDIWYNVNDTKFYEKNTQWLVENININRCLDGNHLSTIPHIKEMVHDGVWDEYLAIISTVKKSDYEANASIFKVQCPKVDLSDGLENIQCETISKQLMNTFNPGAQVLLLILMDCIATVYGDMKHDLLFYSLLAFNPKQVYTIYYYFDYWWNNKQCKFFTQNVSVYEVNYMSNFMKLVFNRSRFSLEETDVRADWILNLSIVKHFELFDSFNDLFPLKYLFFMMLLYGSNIEDSLQRFMSKQDILEVMYMVQRQYDYLRVKTPHDIDWSVMFAPSQAPEQQQQKKKSQSARIDEKETATEEKTGDIARKDKRSKKKRKHKSNKRTNKSQQEEEVKSNIASVLYMESIDEQYDSERSHMYNANPFIASVNSRKGRYTSELSVAPSMLNSDIVSAYGGSINDNESDINEGFQRQVNDQIGAPFVQSRLRLPAQTPLTFDFNSENGTHFYLLNVDFGDGKREPQWIQMDDMDVSHNETVYNGEYCLIKYQDQFPYCPTSDEFKYNRSISNEPLRKVDVNKKGQWEAENGLNTKRSDVLHLYVNIGENWRLAMSGLCNDKDTNYLQLLRETRVRRMKNIVDTQFPLIWQVPHMLFRFTAVECMVLAQLALNDIVYTFEESAENKLDFTVMVPAPVRSYLCQLWLLEKYGVCLPMCLLFLIISTVFVFFL